MHSSSRPAAPPCRDVLCMPGPRSVGGASQDVAGAGRRARPQLGGWLSTELGELLDDRPERLGGVDLVSARSAQQRFDLGQVAEKRLPVSLEPEPGRWYYT